jgi:hypothetical protein
MLMLKETYSYTEEAYLDELWGEEKIYMTKIASRLVGINRLESTEESNVVGPEREWPLSQLDLLIRRLNVIALGQS